MRKPIEILGLAGVHASENETARRWERRLKLPMLTVAVIALVVAYLATGQVDSFVLRYEAAISVGLAAIFTIELLWFMRIVDDRRRFLQHNWLMLVVTLGLVAGLFLPQDQNWVAIARLLRVLIIAVAAARIADAVTGLSPRSAPMLILIGALAIAFCGAAFFVLDPGIHSLGDGMWLSFVTATTVGYGDLVPSTTAARLFAVVTVLLGASMMALLTATITARFLGGEEARQRREMHAEMRQLHHEIAELRATILRGTREAAGPRD